MRTERSDRVQRAEKNREHYELMYRRCSEQLAACHAVIRHKRDANRKLREQIRALRQERDELLAEVDRLREQMQEAREIVADMKADLESRS